MEEENKPVALDEQTEEQNAQSEQEKKEGKISGFFKKMSKKFDDATYNMRLQSDFDSNHKKYTVYCGTGVLSATPEIAVEEHLDEGYLLTLDDNEEIAAGNLIRAHGEEEVYHIASTEKSTLTVEFEGKENEMPAIKVFLGEKAVEVKVIKVEDKFYLA